VFPTDRQGRTLRAAEIAQQAASRFLIKHYRHAGGVDFSGTQPSDRPMGSLDTDRLGRTQLVVLSLDFVPGVPLHRSGVRIDRDRRHGQRIAGTAVFTDEPMTIAEDHAARRRIEIRAFRIRDPLIRRHRRRLSPLGQFYLLLRL
jgi:hypothetical protein